MSLLVLSERERFPLCLLFECPLPAGGLQQFGSANPLFPAVLQAQAAGHRVHEAPEQGGEHRAGDRQG